MICIALTLGAPVIDPIGKVACNKSAKEVPLSTWQLTVEIS